MSHDYALPMAGDSRAHEACADYLPERLPATLRQETLTTTAFRGLSTPGDGGRGTLSDGTNLSPAGGPALTTREARGIYMAARGSGTPHGMAVLDGVLFFAAGTTLYRSDSPGSAVAVGTLSDTDKTFAVLGDQLLILPDKVYYTAAEGFTRGVELETPVFEAVEFSGNTVTLPEGESWTALGFRAGDALRVVNADDVTPAPEGYYRLETLRGRVAYLSRSAFTSYVSNASFRREMPDLEGVAVCGNRVYGYCGRTVYVSAAGSLFNWHVPYGENGEGPATLTADTDGDFTACIPWQGTVVFFKEGRIGKILGSRSDSFYLSELPAPGLPFSLRQSLCEVGGALYYASHTGVYRYEGGIPRRVPLPTAVGRDMVSALGGTDGLCYCLSVTDGAGSIRSLVYDPEGEAWYAEDRARPLFMTQRRGFCYGQWPDGSIRRWATDGRPHGCPYDELTGVGPMESEAVFHVERPFLPDGCRLRGVSLVATAETGATLQVMVAYAEDGYGLDAIPPREVEVATVRGPMTERLIRLSLPPRPCDGVRIRLTMKGSWRISSLTREYERGIRGV